MGFVGDDERLLAAVMRGRTGGTGLDRTTLRQQDTGFTDIKTITAQLAQRPVLAVVLHYLINVIRLFFGGGDAHHVRALHGTAHRLARQILVSLAEERVGFPALRPTGETAWAQSLEQTQTATLAGLVTTLGATQEHMVEATLPILVERVTVHVEPRILRTLIHGHVIRGLRTHDAERLYPPQGKPAKRTLPILGGQIRDNVMHQPTARRCLRASSMLMTFEEPEYEDAFKSFA